MVVGPPLRPMGGRQFVEAVLGVLGEDARVAARERRPGRDGVGQLRQRLGDGRITAGGQQPRGLAVAEPLPNLGEQPVGEGLAPPDAQRLVGGAPDVPGAVQDGRLDRVVEPAERGGGLDRGGGDVGILVPEQRGDVAAVLRHARREQGQLGGEGAVPGQIGEQCGEALFGGVLARVCGEESRARADRHGLDASQ